MISRYDWATAKSTKQYHRLRSHNPRNLSRTNPVCGKPQETIYQSVSTQVKPKGKTPPLLMTMRFSLHETCDPQSIKSSHAQYQKGYWSSYLKTESTIPTMVFVFLIKENRLRTSLLLPMSRIIR